MGAKERLEAAYANVHKPISQDDKAALEVRRLRHDLRPKSETGKKIVGMFSKGFGDIGKSLSTPFSDKRPKIANLSPHKPDIANDPDLSALRNNDMFGSSIRKK